ncbi:MAG TPA: pantothenate kinase [Chroococcales cyanobacterium]
MHYSIERCERSWLALMIGNSRLHWAWFVDGTLDRAWDTSHLSAAAVERLSQRLASGILPEGILPPHVASVASDTSKPLPVYMASVVPEQTTLWQGYPPAKTITLADVPLVGLYPTLGVDRALALLGAGETLGYPVLVIDAGTALTFTGADSQQRLIGGAILPGLRLQFQSLARNTAALPAIQLPSQLPSRWATKTPAAIESGVIYTVLAGMRDFIEDWCCQFPDSQIALTGGDSHLLLAYLQSQLPKTERQPIADPYLIFWGMRSLRFKFVIHNS